MRSVLSFRFLAAVLGLVVAFGVAMSIKGHFGPAGAGAGAGAVSPTSTLGSVVDGPPVRRVDFVDRIAWVGGTGLAIVDGKIARDVTIYLEDERTLSVVEGTLAVDLCQDSTVVPSCAVVADLLGDAVVWFALVPYDGNGIVEMPAIDYLDGGAVLVNGWKLDYAPILSRRCGDRRFLSYGEFKAALGTDFSTVYDIDERRLVAVVCPRVELVDSTQTTTTVVGVDG